MEESIVDETESEPGHSEEYFSEAADIIEDTTKTDEVAIEPESRKSSGAHAVVANGKAAKQEPAPDVRSIIFSLPERFERKKPKVLKQ
ncbi:MAG: hypothetical protein R3C26_00585 [Calditrichia bacterium]